MTQSNLAFDLTEAGLVPDLLLRRGIKSLVKQRLSEIRCRDTETSAKTQQAFLASMSASPIAILPEKANEQHYEVPAEFFSHVLGKFRKYSCCYWEPTTQSLSSAEALALLKTCEHADLADGQDILELGCGWGSLTLYMAKNFPESRITAVSNSNSQRAFILSQAAKEQIKNIQVITCDMNDFDTPKQFDRVVSVEMMEHMRNYQKLYGKIAGWLRPEGKLFKHIFVHRNTPYAFDVRDESDWMSKYFFSGGMMPSDDLPLWFQDDLKIEKRWRWSGTHYEKTANAWLKNMDAQRNDIYPILEQTYGVQDAEKWWNRWRMFFMACAELFGYDNGQEWFVSHYRFQKQAL